MGRYSNTNRNRVEIHEGALGCLASASLLLDIVNQRVSQARPQHAALLTPALEDIEHIKRLIGASQGYIASTLPTSRASEV